MARRRARRLIRNPRTAKNRTSNSSAAMIGRLQSGRWSTTDLTASATSSVRLWVGLLAPPPGAPTAATSAAGERRPLPFAPVNVPSPGTTPRTPIGAFFENPIAVAYAPSAAGRRALGLSGAERGGRGGVGAVGRDGVRAPAGPAVLRIARRSRRREDAERRALAVA